MAGKVAVLIMLQGHEPGARYKLKEQHVTTIGRSSQSDISVVSPTVSRNHCEIAYIDGLWHIADLESRKGTIVNGEKIEGRCVLKPGDIIRLSTNVFRFDFIDEDQPNEGLLALREAAMNGEIRQKSLAEEGSLAAIRERGRIELDEKRWEKRARGKGAASMTALLPNIVFVLVGALLVLAIAGVVYHWKSQQVRTVMANQKSREKQATDALSDLQAKLDKPDLKLAEAIAQAQAIVKQYPRTEAAHEVVETVLPKLKVRQAEAQWAELDKLVEQALELERQQRFQDAITLIEQYANGAVDPELKAFLSRLKAQVLQAAEAAYRAVDQRANELLARDDKSTAAIQYRIVLDQFKVPSLVERARKRLREIESQ